MNVIEVDVGKTKLFSIGQQYNNNALVIHFVNLPTQKNKYIYYKIDDIEEEIPLVSDLFIVSRPLMLHSGEVKAQIITRDENNSIIELTNNFTMRIKPSNYSGIGEDERYPDDPNVKNYFVKIDEKLNSFEELANLVQTKLDNGEFVGAQGPKGEKGEPGEKGDPGDVTEEYRNLANQIAQNATSAQTSATNAQVSATNAQKALDDTKEFANQAISELNQIKTDTSALKDEANTSAVNAKASETKAKEYADNLQASTDDISQLKEDLVNQKKAINELNEKKITKFYASNQGEIHITDSDNGLIQDLKIYGKSKQDGEPSPSNPVEIKNVVNPKVSVCGSNILQKEKKYINLTKFDGNVTLNDDESISYEGSILNAYTSIYIQRLTLKKGTYQLLANQYSSSNDIGAKLIIEKANGNFYVLNNAPFTIDADDTKCRLFISSEGGSSYPLPVSGIVRCALVYSGSTTDIQPYIEQSVTLPITLNAIPVTQGGNVTINGQQYIADYVDVERGKLVRKVDSSKLDNTQTIIDKSEWLLTEPQETDLTTEQTQALKELATYYHVTNISVNSEQLDGYAVFNYPISLANGWNYVKQQLNDNRDYIYDMDIQSAEAYVNSEYAVTLIELGV